MAAGVVFALTELVRWLRTRRLPDDVLMAYRIETAQFREGQSDPMRRWYWSAVQPVTPDSEKFSWPSDRRWERNVARAQVRGRMLLNAGWLIWGIIIAQLVMILCTWWFHWQLSAFLSKAGIVVATLALPARIGFLFTKWRDPAQRGMTTFWDIATFWPRSYHPFAPPCYAEGAVPELQRRMSLLRDRGRQLVLVAHGQGAMIATAALVQLGLRPADVHPALVTFGSTVGKLYGWGFPAYVTPELVSLQLGPRQLKDWHNLYYSTDLLGGPVAGEIRAADGYPVDLSLRDPAHSWYIYGEDRPMPRGHSGYWDDPRVMTLINRVAAEARSVQVTAGGQPGVPASPAGTAKSDS